MMNHTWSIVLLNAICRSQMSPRMGSTRNINVAETIENLDGKLIDLDGEQYQVEAGPPAVLNPGKPRSARLQFNGLESFQESDVFRGAYIISFCFFAVDGGNGHGSSGANDDK